MALQRLSIQRNGETSKQRCSQRGFAAATATAHEICYRPWSTQALDVNTTQASARALWESLQLHVHTGELRPSLLSIPTKGEVRPLSYSEQNRFSLNFPCMLPRPPQLHAVFKIPHPTTTMWRAHKCMR
jgi:hypothetical protein